MRASENLRDFYEISVPFFGQSICLLIMLCYRSRSFRLDQTENGVCCHENFLGYWGDNISEKYGRFFEMEV